jgi:hypothetical protein
LRNIGHLHGNQTTTCISKCPVFSRKLDELSESWYHYTINLLIKSVGMVDLLDTMDFDPIGRPCKFEPFFLHQKGCGTVPQNCRSTTGWDQILSNSTDIGPVDPNNR